MEMLDCDGCGLTIEGGALGCQVLFERVCAANHERPGPYRVHRVLVDAYALQHPARYCESAKSLHAHLGGLHAEFECDGDPEVLAAQQRALSGRIAQARPDARPARGVLTIRDVLAAAEGPPRHQVIGRYAREQWDAWALLHGAISQWTREALRHRR